MPRLSTAIYTTEYGNIFGDKAYEQKARQILPILVRQARSDQPITYGQLALEVGIPNARNLNYPLGTVGGTLTALSKEWGEEIPSIQALVVNHATGLPGEGISDFLEDPEGYKRSPKRYQVAQVDKLLWSIYRYAKWDKVLKALKLKPSKTFSTKVNKKQTPAKYPAGSGEGRAHKSLKNYISKHPDIIGLKKSFAPGEVEFAFPSLDSVDVVFENKKEVVGVEVKSHTSNEDDIRRGLWQCVKYKALLETRERVNQRQRDVSLILAMGKPFPSSLIGEQNTLGIDVREAKI
jgi:hypothetical protein